MESMLKDNHNTPCDSDTAHFDANYNATSTCIHLFTKMTLERSAFLISAILMTFTFFAISIGQRSCPEIVTIKKGGTKIVSCNTSLKRVVKAYWYIGDPAATKPILRLEDGNPGGTMYRNGHYNITSSGAMIIINATIQQEAMYSVLIFFHNGTDLRGNIQVNVTISPEPSCPVLNVCNSCGGCNLTNIDNGTLTCSLDGIRPLIPLNWIFKPQEGVNVIKHPPTFLKNSLFDTWSTTIEISYTVSSCIQGARFQCLAQDDYNILKQTKAAVDLHAVSKNCTMKSDGYNGEGTKKVLIVVGVFTGIILATVFVTFIFMRERRENAIRNQGYSSPPIIQLSSQPKITDEKAAKEWLNKLKEHYKASYRKSSLPWTKKINMDELYVACTCEILNSNGDRSFSYSDRMLAYNALKDERFVLITGRPMHWEKLFAEHLVHQWVHTNINDSVLMFIEKENISLNNKIIDILSQELSINIGFLDEIIKYKKCILVLHGLMNVDPHDRVNNQGDSKEHENIHSHSLRNLTLRDLFQGTEGNDLTSQFTVWISTRNKDNIKGQVDFPDRLSNVFFSGIDVKQVGHFIDKAYKQRTRPRQQPSSRKNVLHNNSCEATKTEEVATQKAKNENNSSDEPVRAEMGNKFASDHSKASNEDSVVLPSIIKPAKGYESFKQEKEIRKIIQCFEKDQFFREFENTPILLSIMAHAVIEKYCSDPCNFDDEKTLNSEGMVCTMINWLLKETKLEDGSKIASTFYENLGKLAIHFISEQKDCVDIHSEIGVSCKEDLNFALKHGILQCPIKYLETELQADCPEPVPYCVEFSHRYLKYYFAAYYNVNHKEYYTDKLVSYDASKNFPVLKFTIHLEERHIDKVLQFFRKFKDDNDIIDILYEWDNQSGAKKLLSQLNGKELKVTGLDEERHHNAVKSFCEKSIRMQIQLKSLQVIGTVTSWFFEIDLPDLAELAFLSIAIDEEIFLKIFHWLRQRNMTVRFIMCAVPREFNKTFKNKLNDVEIRDVKLKIIHQPDEKENLLFTFNYKTVKWTKESTRK